jgi:HlyD family secretion protein
MKIKRLAIILLFTALVSFSTACSSKDDKAKSVSTGNTNVVQSIHTYGIVKCPDIKNIYVDFPAVVDKVHVDIGQKVKIGDLLVSLNKDSAMEQLKNKEQNLKIANMQLDKIKNNINILQNELRLLKKSADEKVYALKNGTDLDIIKITNSLEKEKNELVNLQKEIDKNESLLKSGAIAEKELDIIKDGFEEKKISINEIKLSLEMLNLSKKKELDQLKQDISSKELQLEDIKTSEVKIQEENIAILEDDLNSIKVKLDKDFLKGNGIYSTANGIVDEIGYSPGEKIIDSKKVLSIVNNKNLIIEADIVEEQIIFVKQDMEVTFTIQSQKAKKYSGKVISISNKAESKNGGTTVKTRISVNDIDDFIRPGFNVDIEIPVGSSR